MKCHLMTLTSRPGSISPSCLDRVLCQFLESVNAPPSTMFTFSFLFFVLPFLPPPMLFMIK